MPPVCWPVVPVPNPTKRLVVVSDAVSSRKPWPWMVWLDAPPESAQPLQPAVFTMEEPVAAALTRLVHATSRRTGVVSPGGAPPPGTRSCDGTLTTKASSRLPPALLVQMKYCPVTSRLLFGSLV